MAKKAKYRLTVLVIIKERAKKDAEVALAKALKELEEEKEKLKKLTQEKKKIEDHIEKERMEMSLRVARGDALVKDPQIRLSFIRKLKEDLEDVEKKIEEQKEEIKRAERKLQRCRNQYIIAAQELNTMERHRELWEKKQKRALNAEENKQMNELGNVIHQLHQRAS